MLPNKIGSVVDWMPNRMIFNKYGYFVSVVKKVAKKKSCCEEDTEFRKKAMLIAALSSNHSWKTFRYIHGDGEFDKDAITNETSVAFNDKWKDINEGDVEEVVNSNINDHLFSMWLFQIIPKEDRKEYKGLLGKIREEFVNGLEMVERIEA